MATAQTTMRASLHPGSGPVTHDAPSIRSIWPAPPITLLLVALVLPLAFSVGPIALSPYRFVLLVLTIPTLGSWLSGKAGRIRAADILLLLFCLWCALAILAVHGPEQAFEAGGMLCVETFVAYLIARCHIRTQDDFRATARVILILTLFLLPLALFETISGQKPTLSLFRALGPTIQEVAVEPRWGLTRAQGPFEHPILFGVFSGGSVALIHLAMEGKIGFLQRWTMTGLGCLTVVLSMSSGPIAALLLQLGLIAWNTLFKGVSSRWRVLWGIGAIVYVVAESATAATVPQILTRFAFDQWTAFYRLLIFDYGWASVMAHPFFGTGFGDWLHPAWMSPSIDMFWMVSAIRHGLPAVTLLLLAFLTAVIGVGLRPIADGTLYACRAGYIISMAGFFAVGWTVHFWNATHVLFFCLLGSGMWILDAPDEPDKVATRTRSVRSRPLRLSRDPQALARRSSCASS